MDSMDKLKKALDRFQSAHTEFFSPGSGYSVGYGLDPDRKGPNGIIVYAMHDDETSRNTLLDQAKVMIPSSWDGFPIYTRGTSVPRPYTAR